MSTLLTMAVGAMCTLGIQMLRSKLQDRRQDKLDKYTMEIRMLVAGARYKNNYMLC
jgi:hypothetical protein